MDSIVGPPGAPRRADLFGHETHLGDRQLAAAGKTRVVRVHQCRKSTDVPVGPSVERPRDTSDPGSLMDTSAMHRFGAVATPEWTSPVAL